MKALIACEESQTVCIEFRKLGHEAYSCDVMPCSGGHPEWHFKEDIRLVLALKSFDLVIAFPPCTDLAVSGARYFEQKKADGRQQMAIDFFMRFPRLKCKWAIENPVGIMSTVYRKPDQIIQPWQFGEDASKKTCLWLNGLPLLKPTKILEGGANVRRANQTPSGQNKLGPSPDRARLRSVTYQGIARAMAQQWGTDSPLN